MESIDISKELPRHKTKKYAKRKLDKVNRIVVHCTDADWSIVQLAEYDIRPNHISADGCAAITYHDVIMKNGAVFHTLPYEEASSHAGGYNVGSVAVSLMYVVTDPVTKKDTYGPSAKALSSLSAHCGKLCLLFGLTPDRVFGHRELKGTGWFLNSQGSKRLRKTCPGLQIDLDLLRHNVAEYMQILLKIKGYYKGEVDGDFGTNSKKALALYCKNK